MIKFDIARTVATVACTIVFSATALLAAVGPATHVTSPVAVEGSLAA